MLWWSRRTPRARAALTAAAVVAGYAAVLLAVWWRVWLGDQVCGWDCMDEYWPDLVYARRAIADGEWPSWNPYVIGGYAIGADPQVGLYAPASWAAWGLGAIGGDGPWLIQVKVMLTFLAGMVGMHGWVHARTRSHAAAAVAALTFGLGSPVLVFKNSALAWPVLYLPWALWALERFAARPSPRRGAALALGVWLVGAAGSPPGAFYAALVIAAYAAFLVAASPAWRAGSPRRIARAAAAAARRAGPGAAVAAVLAAGLLAATYVPASLAAEASPRAHRTLDYVLQQPLPWGQLRELFVPGVAGHWALDVYVGPLALIGGIALVAVRRGRARAEAAWWVGLAVIAIGLAAGRAGHLLPWLAEHVPGFGLFRIAYRYKLVMAVPAALLAGEVVAAAARARAADAGAAPRWAPALLAALGAAWLAIAAAIALRAPAWPLAAATIAAVVALPHLRGAARAAALAAIPALVLADLWHAGRSTLAILQRRPDLAQVAPLVAALPDTGAAWRYHVGDIVPPYGGTVPYHVPALAQRRELSGYPNPLEPARRLELERRGIARPELLAHFNVRYLAGHRRRPPGARPVAPRIVELPDVAPLARWYGGVEALRGGELLDRLEATPPSALRAALVEPRDVRGLALPAAGAAAPPPVDGALVRYGRAEIEVAIDAPAPGVLVLNEAFAPGWVAEVGGRATPVFRAHYHLRAVAVPAGPSRVVFRYRPPGRVALPLAFLAALAAAGALLAARRRPGRPGEEGGA